MTESRQDNLLHSALRLSVLAIFALVAALFFNKWGTGLAETPLPAAESPGAGLENAGPRYFQTRPGVVVRPEDLGAQLKRVAAARGASADQVRQLVNARGREEQWIDVRALNQELDVRWPMK